MNSLASTTKIPILDGLCRLYKRPDSDYWWAICFNHNKTIRSSTKETDLEAAKAVATKWYIKKQAEIAAHGVPATVHRTDTFAFATDKAYEEYEAEIGKKGRSKSYIDGLKKSFNKLKQLSIAKKAVASVDHTTWDHTRKELLKGNPKLSDRTLHQYRNSIQIVLKQAFKRGDIKVLPTFLTERTGATDDTPRTFFDAREYEDLQTALLKNIAKKIKEGNGHAERARELKDYVTIVANTGMRSGPNSEAMNVRFRDVTIAGKGKQEYLVIKEIKGKRTRDGQGRCTSFSGEAPEAFRCCVKRRGLTLTNYKNSEEPIFKEFHRDMFKTVLLDAGLYQTTGRVKRKRDLMSLRNTYICFAQEAGIDVWDVAKNCRTSVEMIQRHYARHKEPDHNRFNKARTVDAAIEAEQPDEE